jgi:hypothetical protein
MYHGFWLWIRSWFQAPAGWQKIIVHPDILQHILLIDPADTPLLTAVGKSKRLSLTEVDTDGR